MFYVIFDMDGTLLDSQRVYIPAWDLAGEEQGIAQLGGRLSEVCGMNEAGWSNFLTERYPALDLERFKRRVFAYVKENQVVSFKKGAIELLDFLKENGVRMAVASGSDTQMVCAHMEKLGASHYFDVIVGGEQVCSCKPAPDIYLKAAAALGAEPAACFAFEDSANGVRAAHAAGMKCFGIPDIAPLTAVKELLFASLSDLSEAIGVLKTIIDQ